ncbi:hypothetical protein KJ807_05740, partial [Patescibacteria group bacterium]|nr:hypothetical protein [Patescibacteria group bacterium]
LANIYGEITGGVRVECNSDGSFWLNNIEVKKLLTLYSSRPTEKAKLYLEGMKNKLCWIIQSKNVTNKNDGIRAVAQSMVAQIEETLERVPTRKLLPDAHSRAS